MSDRLDLPVANLSEGRERRSLPHDGDLDANVVRFAAGEAIDEHVNDEADVLMAVWSGVGDLNVGE